jgi:hypothetical protein
VFFFIEDNLHCYEHRKLHYRSFKHDQMLFKYDYMFQSNKNISRPTLQKHLK